MTIITVIQSFMLCFVATIWSSRGGLNLLVKIALLASGLAPLVYLAVSR